MNQNKRIKFYLKINRKSGAMVERELGLKKGIIADSFRERNEMYPYYKKLKSVILEFLEKPFNVKTQEEKKRFCAAVIYSQGLKYKDVAKMVGYSTQTVTNMMSTQKQYSCDKVFEYLLVNYGRFIES